MFSSMRFLLRLPRLAALVAAVVVVGSAVIVSVFTIEWTLKHMPPVLAPLPLVQKNQGTLLQRQAFANTKVLPVYGSSELTRPMEFRASEFFDESPTGFLVCPIGCAGNTSLMTTMKIASLGGAVRGRKMAYLLSQSWFLRPCQQPDHYAGNFSALQAIQTLRNPLLSDALKHRIAARMLDYPETLESHPALRMEALAYRDGLPLGNLARPLLAFALRIEKATLECEDALQCYLQLQKLHGGKVLPVLPQAIDWPRVLASAAAAQPPSVSKLGPLQPAAGAGPLDAVTRRDFASAEHGEWTDLAILLDVLKELHVRALMITIPVGGLQDNHLGITFETRKECYYSRIENMCRERGIAVNTMIDHDLDTNFLDGFTSHPTRLGWLYIDQLLDDFFHGRYPAKYPSTANTSNPK